ncbi:uncharacterized protein LOC34617996 [Cyclospora cayetanensis]|uniref:Uncharacterized protein n=2 Tax=Cyclospora cayetanensis TaxID=88456 RepID=A0A1D3D2J0_9EIME|nr:uncharacterized protein LOC34617996 [Cyclospora cayetanensis]OEH77663.1 hypothetical protein cyc_00899 [Cyclospora cayetanensis]
MLTNVWNSILPGCRNRQNCQTHLEVLQADEVTEPSALPSTVSRSTGGSGAMSPRHSTEQTCSCSADQRSCTTLGQECSCMKCSTCLHATRKTDSSGGNPVTCDLQVALVDFSLQHQEEQHGQAEEAYASISEDEQILPPVDPVGAPDARCSRESLEEAAAAAEDHPSAIPSTPFHSHEETHVCGLSSQRQEQYLVGSVGPSLAEGPKTRSSIECEHTEGWEHIQNDNGGCPVAAAVAIESAEQGVNIPGTCEKDPKRSAGSLSGRSSPLTEFEFVHGAPVYDALHLLRLTQRQQLRGWDWACAGLVPLALVERRHGDSHSAPNAAVSAAATAAAVGETIARRGSAVVQILRSAVLSGVRARREPIEHQGSLHQVVALGSGEFTAAEPASTILSGWCGRWQLTSVDSPKGSLSSCWSGDQRKDSALSTPSESSSKSGKSPSRSSRKRPAEPQLLQLDSAGAAVCSPRPASCAAISAFGVHSDTQQGTMPACDEPAEASSCSAQVAPQAEISCSATDVSEPPEGGYSDASGGEGLSLLLHQAQQHLERQCRRRLQRNDLRLNILATALPGVDVGCFCQQMFVEWQQVRHQRVSCGEESVFRVPFAAPFVEVPVIAATSFASALPYCELRVLEKWESVTAVQAEPTERRVHVCLFLIPQSVLPLSTEILALLKRLRAVTCLLPLLVVLQHTTPDQISRDTRTLRLQLASADLATLEEMFLPVHQDVEKYECAACRHRKRQQAFAEGRQSPPQQLPHPETLPTVGKCSSSTIPFSGPESVCHSPEVFASENAEVEKGHGGPFIQSQPLDDEADDSQGRTRFEDTSCVSNGESVGNSTSFGGASLCRSAVHLPLVLQLPLGSGNEENNFTCTCWAGNCSDRIAIATPVSLRQMLVDASAMLLRQRAEHRCFLPFLFQHQMQPNRTLKLRGLQEWERDEQRQRQQQEHMEALVEMRQGQINNNPHAATKQHLQRQLDKLRQQLRRMQRQLLHLQERRFLQRLLRDETAVSHFLTLPDNTLLIPNGTTETEEKEEMLSHRTQMGLLVAFMIGVGVLLFTTIKRSNH